MKTKKTTKKSALSKHLSAIGQKGGQTTMQRHGKEHFKKAAETRWKKK